MKHSPLRHPVAVLRKIIGINQQEFANFVGRKRRSIQAIELGSLKLSEDLARRIALETGVSLEWLLLGDPTVEPYVDTGFKGIVYGKADFEHTRAAIAAGKKPGESSMRDWIMMRLKKEKGYTDRHSTHDEKNPLLRGEFEVQIAKILSALFASDKAGRLVLAAFRLSEFAKAMDQEFGQTVDKKSCGASADFLELCLAHVLAVGPAIDYYGASSHPPDSPELGRPVNGERLLDPWYKVWHPERLENRDLWDESVLAAIQRTNIRNELLTAIRGTTRQLSPKPLAPRSRKVGEPPRNHGQ